MRTLHSQNNSGEGERERKRKRKREEEDKERDAMRREIYTPRVSRRP